jgi:hypothetical protein
MQVTFTNASSEDVFLSLLYKNLAAGESVTVSKSRSELDMEQELKKLVAAGTIVLAFAVEDGDDAALGTEPWPPYADATRPAPADWPLFGAIWNTDDDALNWTDGTNWRDAAGAIT